MRNAGWFPTATAVLVIAVCGCSRSDNTSSSSAQPPGRPPAIGTGGAGADVKSDSEFVRDIAMKNMAEIQLSRIAIDRAASPNIKAFAQKILDDHATAGDKLKSVASESPVDWPAQLDDEHRKTAGELNEKQGAEFDRAYVTAMVEGHQDLAAKLEARLDVQSLADWKTAAAGRTQSKAMPDPKAELSDVEVRPARSDSEITMKINQWVAETYPLVQKHLDTARALEKATEERSPN